MRPLKQLLVLGLTQLTIAIAVQAAVIVVEDSISSFSMGKIPAMVLGNCFADLALHVTTYH